MVFFFYSRWNINQESCTYKLEHVIGSLRPSVVFGCKGILIIFGIFQAYETQRVRLKQVNDSRFVRISINNLVARNQNQFLSFKFLYIFKIN